MNWLPIGEFLKTGAGVSTAFGLAGLIVVALLCVVYLYLKHKTDHVQALPEGERTATVDSYLGRYSKMDLSTLTPKQKYDILMTDTRKSQNIVIAIGIMVTVVVLGCFAMAVFGSTSPSQPRPVPAELPVSVCITAADSALPAELFGDLVDDVGRPRQWMRLIDDGGKARLKAEDVVQIWLITGAFEGLYSPFTAHVNAGTPNKVVRCAFLLRPVAGEENAKVNLIPLDEAGASGRPGLYLFKVPTAAKDSRLLIFLGMTKASYDGILAATKFNVRSRP